MADLLPQCLIHKILCLHSFKRAAQLSILSKTWLQAWLTIPNLSYSLGYLEHNMKKVMDNIMERYRDGKIPIEKLDLSYSVDSNEVFPLFNKWLDIALQNGVKDLVFRIPSHLTSYPLPMLTILATKSLRELVLTGCDLYCASLSSGVVNCYSLRKLSLTQVGLGDNTLQILLNSCPFIDNLILDYCSWLKKIEILNNLPKIKSVSIRKSGTELVKIQAPTLEHLSYFTGVEEFAMFDIDAPNLVSLEYKGFKFPATFMDTNLQWSCYPTRFVLDSTSETIASVMDVLMHMMSSSHSTSHGSNKPLHRQLKEVKADKFDWENQRWHCDPVELGSERMAIRDLKDKFCFLLYWSCN
ncbi:FBD-associated F-box protein At3g52670-like [Solanum verrucosum]|uniref:FBD-associated F-box protein At3g52670-like n=1 Tax=Solanum verrucosum TaxID=315347 RepID=UPI0020D16182|nr:FBD-associated F-box protein At3g52670-like [Solanum verrucosum]